MIQEYLTGVYKAAAYIRLSKEDGDKAESESITNQKIFIKEFIDRSNFEFIDFYVDDGFSGGNFERPAFKKMIEDIKLKKINCVITKDTSRLGRDFIETGNYMFKFFPENNVRYIAILENFDTYKPNGVEDMIPFQTIINDMYLKDISKKVKSIRRNKMNQGLYVGSTVSYGYKRSEEDNRKFIIDEYSSKVVKRIFNLKLEGLSNLKIANILTSDGIEPPSVYNNKSIRTTVSTNIWKDSSIKTILTNEVYIGSLIQGKYEQVSYKSKKKKLLPRDKWIIIENNHEPIIDKEIFYKVNEIMIRKSENGNYRTRKHEFMLKGLVVCADCGKPMLVRKSYTKKNDAHYLCKTYASKYGSKMCTMHWIKENDINDYVVNELNHFLKKIDKNLLSASYDKHMTKLVSVGDYKNDLIEIKTKLETMDKAISDLYLDKSNGYISMEEFSSIKNDLTKNKDKLLKQQEDLEYMLNNIKEDKDDKYKLKVINDFIRNNNPTKIVLSELIKRIEVKQDKSIKIFYNFNISESAV